MHRFVQPFPDEYKNDGNVSILPSDFYGEFTCSFGNSTKVLAAEITDGFPDSFKPHIELKDNLTTITPILINSKDFFVIKFLLSQFDKLIKINGRISGVQDIKKIYKKVDFSPFLNGIGFLLLGFGLIAKEFLDSASQVTRSIVTVSLFLLALAIGLAFYYRKKVKE